VPEPNRDMVNIILGAIVTVGFGSVYAFYFGSTRGSEQKTAALATSVEATATLAATAKTAGEALAASSTPANDGKVTLAPGTSVEVEAEGAEADDPAMFGGPRP
jgi:type IV secretory pathway VirB6-like protein